MILETQFIQHWRERFAPAAAGGPVLLAVSGGLDSMVMAHLFLLTGQSFAVAHCNFTLRGAEADADEAMVSEWCAERDIRFFGRRFPTREIAARQKTGIQETARQLRYQWFDELRTTHGFSLIATAHHADDHAETMLLHLCRGTGISGLHGIPARNGAVVRPLLFATRDVLAAYAAAHGIRWREDASNSSDDYLRNALRHRVLPVLEELFPGLAGRLLDTGRRIAEAEQLYQEAISSRRKKLLEQRGRDYYVPVRLLSQYRPLLTICYELFRPFGFTAAQTASIPELLQAERGKFIASATHRIIRDRGFLIVTELEAAGADFILIQEADLPLTLQAGGQTFRCSLEAATGAPAQDDRILTADRDKLRFPLVLRRRKEGDYLYPLGMGMKKKKVSKLLSDRRMALHEKEQVWVLESDRRIVWIAGIRPDERFRITPGTAQVLRVELL